MKNPKLTPVQSSILKGKTCPYCLKASKLIKKEGTEKEYLYSCEPCGAYCGTHQGTKTSYGRLAKEDLRKLRIETHVHFDKLHKDPKAKLTRTEAYKLLSDHLGTPTSLTHIGMFNSKSCQRVIDFSIAFLQPQTRIVIGCNYHVTDENGNLKRYILAEVVGTKARLHTRQFKEAMWVNVRDIVFIESEKNRKKARNIIAK